MSSEQPDFIKSQTLEHKNSEKSSEKEQWKRYEAHEGLFFCLELTPTMYLSNKELGGKIQLLEILDSINELLAELVVVMPGTAVGCFFFNCSHPDAKDNIYQLFPMVDINYKNMKKVSDLLGDLAEGRLNLEEALPIASTKGPIELSPVLVSIREQFLKPLHGQKLYTNKKILLFTDDDTPAEFTAVESRVRLRRIIDDLYDYHINFHTFFIGSEEKPFDNSTYADILKWGSKVEESSTWFYGNGPNTKPINASYIKSKVKRSKEIKRIKFRCPFIIDERVDLTVSINGYTIFSEEIPGSRYKLVYIHGDTRKEAFAHREYIDSETGERIDEDNLARVYAFGKDYIELTEEETLKIQNSYGQQEAFLKLIGFRETSKCLHFYDNIDTTTFVVPSEEDYIGSVDMMASLYRTLLSKEKSAVVWGKLRPNSLPSLFVLSPTLVTDLNQGFYLTRVPFVDEVRKLPEMIHYDKYLEGEDYEALCKVTETIVNFFNLKNGYSPSAYRNPALQKHFSVLRDYLLQIEQVEKSEQEVPTIFEMGDDTMRKVMQVHERIASSANSDDPKQQRLVKYIKLWKTLYNRMANVDIEIDNDSSKQKRAKVNI